MNLNEVNLLDLQTSYLQQDPTVQAICKALNPYFRKLSEDIKSVLIYGRIDDLDEDVMDELAWQFHVDFYDTSLSLDKKKILVKNSIWWHKIKGTPEAVIDVVTSIFGNTELNEWFQYNGKPYYFSLDIDIIDEILAKENLKQIYELISKYKNTRSWLETLRLHLHAKSQSNIYLGSTLVSTIHYVLTSDYNLNYNSNSNEKVAATAINTHQYTLTSDINTNYSSESKNKAASTLINSKKYILSNDINKSDIAESKLNNASVPSISMHYELS
ncbi:phage tail protein I [Clostridium botulinum]|nr:phage tail protein I [Clostridium botulinum]